MNLEESTAKFLKRLLIKDPFIGRELISDQGITYKIMAKIGEGGMGSVYKALCPKGQEVAIKVATAEQAVSRFRLETVILKLLGNHENIPELIGWGLEQSKIKFCVMEFVSGISLGNIIRRRSEWFYANPLRHTINIGVQMLTALSHVHHYKIVHRDIKPHNVILVQKPDGTYNIKLMDFGVAKILEKGFLGFLHRSISFDEKTLTLPGQPIGTLGYAAPEQIDNVRPMESADIFSLGISLFELVQGDFLLIATTISEYLRQLADFVFTPLEFSDEKPEVVNHFNAIIKKAIEKDPKNRYSRADRMLKDFLALQREYYGGK